MVQHPGLEIKGNPLETDIFHRNQEIHRKMSLEQLKSVCYTQEKYFPGDCERFRGGFAGTGDPWQSLLAGHSYRNSTGRRVRPGTGKRERLPFSCLA